MSNCAVTYGITVSVAGLSSYSVLALHSDGVIAWALVHMVLYEYLYPNTCILASTALDIHPRQMTANRTETGQFITFSLSNVWISPTV